MTETQKFIIETAKVVFDSTVAVAGVGFLGNWLLKKLERNKDIAVLAAAATKSPIIEEINVDDKIYKKLWQALARFNADRVTVYQYHNGEQYFSGRHIKKYTATHEVVAFNVLSNMELCQSKIMSGEDHIFVRHLIENSYIYIPDIALEEVFVEAKRAMRHHGQNSGFSGLMKTADEGHPIGNLYLGFKRTSPLTPEELGDVMYIVDEISSILFSKV